MKTIAGEPELQVTYGTEAPALQGNKAKLPQVSAELNPNEVAVTRGIADSFAMRISSHDDRVHTHYRPEGKNARAMYGRSSRRASRLWGPVPCPAWPRTSPPCL